MTTQVRTICVSCARGTNTFVKQYRSFGCTNDLLVK
jgi:hypothetical protein